MRATERVAPAPTAPLTPVQQALKVAGVQVVDGPRQLKSVVQGEALTEKQVAAVKTLFARLRKANVTLGNLEWSKLQWGSVPLDAPKSGELARDWLLRRQGHLTNLQLQLHKSDLELATVTPGGGAKQLVDLSSLLASLNVQQSESILHNLEYIVLEGDSVAYKELLAAASNNRVTVAVALQRKYCQAMGFKCGLQRETCTVPVQFELVGVRISVHVPRNQGLSAYTFCGTLADFEAIVSELPEAPDFRRVKFSEERQVDIARVSLNAALTSMRGGIDLDWLVANNAMVVQPPDTTTNPMLTGLSDVDKATVQREFLTNGIRVDSPVNIPPPHQWPYGTDVSTGDYIMIVGLADGTLVRELQVAEVLLPTGVGVEGSFLHRFKVADRQLPSLAQWASKVNLNTDKVTDKPDFLALQSAIWGLLKILHGKRWQLPADVDIWNESFYDVSASPTRLWLRNVKIDTSGFKYGYSLKLLYDALKRGVGKNMQVVTNNAVQNPGLANMTIMGNEAIFAPLLGTSTYVTDKEQPARTDAAQWQRVIFNTFQNTTCTWLPNVISEHASVANVAAIPSQFPRMVPGANRRVWWPTVRLGGLSDPPGTKYEGYLFLQVRGTEWQLDLSDVDYKWQHVLRVYLCIIRLDQASVASQFYLLYVAKTQVALSTVFEDTRGFFAWGPEDYHWKLPKVVSTPKMVQSLAQTRTVLTVPAAKVPVTTHAPPQVPGLLQALKTKVQSVFNGTGDNDKHDDETDVDVNDDDDDANGDDDDANGDDDDANDDDGNANGDDINANDDDVNDDYANDDDADESSAEQTASLSDAQFKVVGLFSGAKEPCNFEPKQVKQCKKHYSQYNVKRFDDSLKTVMERDFATLKFVCGHPGGRGGNRVTNPHTACSHYTAR